MGNTYYRKIYFPGYLASVEMMMLRINYLISILFLLLNISFVSAEDFNKYTDIINDAKKATVTINARVALSAYGDYGNWVGTGFIADKNSGLLVTNAHVAGRASIATYFITFYNGRQTEAKLVFYDPFVDFAILSVDPKEIPTTTTEIELNTQVYSALNDEVLVIGNTEAQNFSFHVGYISSLYDINGDMPQASYVINLNSAGGASGSAVIDPKTKKAIGVLYGGGKTYVYALHGEYVTYALDKIKNNQLPTRQHCGVITQLYSLDKAKKHRNFPENIITNYIQKFPNARNKVIMVSSNIASSPAENILQAGDILWAVDNGDGLIELGSDLKILDMAMNNAKSSKIKLVIYRNGVLLEKSLELYDTNNNKVEKMIEFGGGLFFTADDYISVKTGIKLGAVVLINVHNGSSFSEVPVAYINADKSFYRLAVDKIIEEKVENLDDLANVIAKIITNKQKFITIRFKNYQPYMPGFRSQDRDWISAHENLISDVALDSTDNKPRILKYQASQKEWVIEDM